MYIITNLIIHRLIFKYIKRDREIYKPSRLEVQRNAFLRVGAKLFLVDKTFCHPTWLPHHCLLDLQGLVANQEWNGIPYSLRELPKKAFKKRIQRILLILLQSFVFPSFC